jgi:AraC-like DNA-binding protein
MRPRQSSVSRDASPDGCAPARPNDRSTVSDDDAATGDFAEQVSQRGTMVRVASSPSPQRLGDLVLLRRARDRMDREYIQPLNIELLARDALMSAGHFSREFKRAYGESPYSYLMTRRIERAMALLRRGDLSVTDVCFAVGCSSLGTFSTRFTELVGMSPRVYKREAERGITEMQPCVVKQVTRPIRNREATPASLP